MRPVRLHAVQVPVAPAGARPSRPSLARVLMCAIATSLVTGAAVLASDGRLRTFVAAVCVSFLAASAFQLVGERG